MEVPARYVEFRIQLPPHAEAVNVLVEFVDPANAQEPQVRLMLVPAPEPPPRSPGGPQLWLPYPGWECDAGSWRPLDF